MIAMWNGQLVKIAVGTGMMSARRPAWAQRPSRSSWRVAARLGQLAWLFGNLYEGVVGVPQLLGDARAKRAPSLLGAGSPVRFYAPVAPLALGATAVTLVKSWRDGNDQRLIATVAGSTAVATVLSAYLIRTVNVPLLVSAEPLPDGSRRRLIRTWHLMNAVRLVALVAAVSCLLRLERQRR